MHSTFFVPTGTRNTARHQRNDNRIENLELWSVSQPAGQRIEDKVAWAKHLLALYEPSALVDGDSAAA